LESLISRAKSAQACSEKCAMLNLMFWGVATRVLALAREGAGLGSD
jgi:hypothetical protein